MKLLSKRMSVLVAMLLMVTPNSGVLGYSNVQPVSDVFSQENSMQMTTSEGIMLLNNTNEQMDLEQEKTKIYDLSVDNLIIEGDKISYNGTESKIEGPIVVTSGGRQHFIGIGDVEESVSIILQDASISYMIVATEKPVNLILEGESYIGDNSSFPVIESGCINIQGNGKLYVSGEITSDVNVLSGNLNIDGRYSSCYAMSGIVTVEDGSVEVTGGGINKLIANGGDVYVEVYGGVGIDEAQINGGTVGVSVECEYGWEGNAIHNLTMQDGYLSATGGGNGCAISGDYVTINGGEVYAGGAFWSRGTGIDTDVLTISGGNVSARGGICGVDCGILEITGGKLKAIAGGSTGDYPEDEKAIGIHCNNIIMKGGEIDTREGISPKYSSILYTGGILSEDIKNVILVNEDGDIVRADCMDEMGNALNYASIRCNGAYEIKLNNEPYNDGMSWIENNHLLLLLKPAIYEVMVQNDNEWHTYSLTPDDTSRKFMISEQLPQLSAQDIWIDYKNEIIKNVAAYKVGVEISDTDTFESLINEGDSIKDYIGKDIYLRRMQNNKVIGDIAVVHIPSRPSVPEVSINHVTQSEIALNEIPHALYSLDKVNWQKEATFSDLQPDTIYTIYVQLPATESSFASEVSEVQVETRMKEKFDKPSKEILQIDYSNETLSVDEALNGCVELSTSIKFKSSMTIDGPINISKYIGKTVYVRVKEKRKGEQVTKPSEPLILTIKDRPNKPFVSIEEITDTEIVINPIEDGEYSLDGQNWQKEYIFSNLKPNKVYRVYVRRTATDESFTSKINKKIVITTEEIKEEDQTIINEVVDGLKRIFDFFRF